MMWKLPSSSPYLMTMIILIFMMTKVTPSPPRQLQVSLQDFPPSRFLEREAASQVPGHRGHRGHRQDNIVQESWINKVDIHSRILNKEAAFHVPGFIVKIKQIRMQIEKLRWRRLQWEHFDVYKYRYNAKENLSQIQIQAQCNRKPFTNTNTGTNAIENLSQLQIQAQMQKKNLQWRRFYKNQSWVEPPCCFHLQEVFKDKIILIRILLW